MRLIDLQTIIEKNTWKKHIGNSNSQESKGDYFRKSNTKLASSL